MSLGCCTRLSLRFLSFIALFIRCYGSRGSQEIGQVSPMVHPAVFRFLWHDADYWIGATVLLNKTAQLSLVRESCFHLGRTARLFRSFLRYVLLRYVNFQCEGLISASSFDCSPPGKTGRGPSAAASTSESCDAESKPMMIRLTCGQEST